jgi:hypothetical protein
MREKVESWNPRIFVDFCGDHDLLQTPFDPFGSSAHIASKELEALSRHEASQAGARRKIPIKYKILEISIYKLEGRAYSCLC